MTGIFWSHREAVILCRALEEVAPEFGAHVALTGGTLYKDGLRKDCDVLFYQAKKDKKIDIDGLKKKLSEKIELGRDYGRVLKGKIAGKQVDFFFPERDSDDYDKIFSEPKP